MDPTKLSPFGQRLLNRRKFMSETASLIGSLSLIDLLSRDAALKFVP